MKFRHLHQRLYRQRQPKGNFEQLQTCYHGRRRVSPDNKIISIKIHTFMLSIKKHTIITIYD